MPLLYSLFAFATGAGLPLQALMNGRLAAAMGHPFYGALSNFASGLAFLILFTLAFRPAFAGTAAMAAVPWWLWLSGLGGALFVTAGALVAPALGAAVFISLVVAGQMIGSLALDQFGILQHASSPLTWPRALGAVLLVAGVILIQRK